MEFMTVEMIERVSSNYAARSNVTNKLVSELEQCIYHTEIPNRWDPDPKEITRFGVCYYDWSLALASAVSFDVSATMTQPEIEKLALNLATMITSDVMYFLEHGFKKEQIVRIITNKYKVKVAI